MTDRTRTLLDRSLLILASTIACVLAFSATSFAAGAADPERDATLVDLLRPVLAAFQTGDYVHAGALALVLFVALAKRYAGDSVPWIRTNQGAAALVLVGSFAATLAARLAGPAELTGALAWDALKIAFVAAGGYTALKTLVVVPLLRPLPARYPRLAPVLGMILWIFESERSPTP